MAGCLLVLGSADRGLAATPTVAEMLRLPPKQDGVNSARPDGQELANCKVKLVNGGRRGGSGWLLQRRQRATSCAASSTATATSSIDVWSYYKDGVEVYREIDTNGDGKPDQYRWLNAGGIEVGRGRQRGRQDRRLEDDLRRGGQPGGLAGRRHATTSPGCRP